MDALEKTKSHGGGGGGKGGVLSVLYMICGDLWNCLLQKISDPCWEPFLVLAGNRIPNPLFVEPVP